MKLERYPVFRIIFSNFSPSWQKFSFWTVASGPFLMFLQLTQLLLQATGHGTYWYIVAARVLSMVLQDASRFIPRCAVGRPSEKLDGQRKNLVGQW